MEDGALMLRCLDGDVEVDVEMTPSGKFLGESFWLYPFRKVGEASHNKLQQDLPRRRLLVAYALHILLDPTCKCIDYSYSEFKCEEEEGSRHGDSKSMAGRNMCKRILWKPFQNDCQQVIDYLT